MMNFLSPNVLLLSKIQAFSKLLLRKTREAKRSVALTRDIQANQGIHLHHSCNYKLTKMRLHSIVEIFTMLLI